MSSCLIDFFKLAGVEACFIVPARYVREKPDAPLLSEGADKGQAVTTTLGKAPSHLLVVEDSMIIAMDTEDNLRALGVKTVTAAGNVAAALKSIEQDPPEFAVLDFNLGTETSEPVAQVLRARGIPFVLATGYGELSDKLDESGALDVLKKPYGRADLAELLERLTG